MESLADGGVKASDEQMEEEEEKAKFWHREKCSLFFPYYLGGKTWSDLEACLEPTVVRGSGSKPKIISGVTLIVVPETTNVSVLPTAMKSWN